jgi:hypothetical protein
MKNNAATNILRTPVILPIIGAVVQITVYLCPSMGQLHVENGWHAGKGTGTNKKGDDQMRPMAILGAIICFLLMSFVVYAQEDANHYCMGECGAKGHLLGYCRSLCSTKNELGQQTKDPDCLSSCFSKGYTNYHCYSSCDKAPQEDNAVEEQGIQKIQQ